MDHTAYWMRFLAECPDIVGGAFFTADGVLISSANFGNAENHLIISRCAAVVALAHQLSQSAQRGSLEVFTLVGEMGCIVLIPVHDMAVFAVLLHGKARLGLVMIDISRALYEGPFGFELAAEPILPPRPPKRDSTYVSLKSDG